jgi:hypothetical protein
MGKLKWSAKPVMWFPRIGKINCQAKNQLINNPMASADIFHPFQNN